MIREWNDLDEDIRSAQSVQTFRKRKQHMPNPPGSYGVEYKRSLQYICLGSDAETAT